jgi:hypothetical protein
VRSTGSSSCQNCWRGQVEILCRILVVDKVPKLRSAVYGFCPSLSPAPAGHLRLSWYAPAIQRFSRALRRCVSRRMIGSAVARQPLRSGTRAIGSRWQGRHAMQILRVPVGKVRRSRITTACSGPDHPKAPARGRAGGWSWGRGHARPRSRPATDAGRWATSVHKD